MAKKPLRTVNKLPALRENYDERSLYPWIDMRTAFIEGYPDEDDTIIWPTANQLAERFNAPLQSLQNRISKERWVDHRTAHQNQIAIERRKEEAKKLAGKAVKFDAKSLKIAEMAQDLIEKRLKELVELQKYVELNRQQYFEAIDAGELVRVSDLKASAFSGSELESLMKAFALAAETGRKAAGIKDGEPTINQFNFTQSETTTNIGAELTKSDPDKVAEMIKLLQSPNLRISPGKPQEIIDADVIEETNDGTE